MNAPHEYSLTASRARNLSQQDKWLAHATAQCRRDLARANGCRDCWEMSGEHQSKLFYRRSRYRANNGRGGLPVFRERGVWSVARNVGLLCWIGIDGASLFAINVCIKQLLLKIKRDRLNIFSLYLGKFLCYLFECITHNLNCIWLMIFFERERERDLLVRFVKKKNVYSKIFIF